MLYAPPCSWCSSCKGVQNRDILMRHHREALFIKLLSARWCWAVPYHALRTRQWLHMHGCGDVKRVGMIMLQCSVSQTSCPRLHPASQCKQYRPHTDVRLHRGAPSKASHR